MKKTPPKTFLLSQDDDPPIPAIISRTFQHFGFTWIVHRYPNRNPKLPLKYNVSEYSTGRSAGGTFYATIHAAINVTTAMLDWIGESKVRETVLRYPVLNKE